VKTPSSRLGEAHRGVAAQVVDPRGDLDPVVDVVVAQ
jgi:hypothetical protein